MLKKTIKFEDLDGNQLQEDFYFNLSKAELAEMEIGEVKHGGMKAVLEKIVKEQDGKKILAMLKDLVKNAYGVRSDDGRRFIKNDEVWDNFKDTDAYDELLWELYTDADSASAFVRGIAPSDIQAQIDEAEASGLSEEELRKKAIEQMQGHKSKQA